MNQILHHVLQGLGWAVGLLLIYCAVFLYEDAQKRLQNRLEELWVRIDGKSKGVQEVSRNLIIEASKLVDQVFNRIFGERTMSLRGVIVSAYLALGSTCIELAIYIFYAAMPSIPPDIKSGIPTFLLGGAACFLIPATIVITFRHRAVLFLGSLPLLALTAVEVAGIVFGLGSAHREHSREQLLLFVLGVTLLPCVMDIGWLYFCRRLMRAAASGRGVLMIVVWNLITIALCAPPNYYGLMNPKSQTVFASLMGSLLMTRLFLGVFASILLLLALVALIHRSAWPVVARAIYPLQRFNLASSPKLVGAVGAGLIAVSSGKLGWLEFLMKIGG